jgi:hypothetical protein
MPITDLRISILTDIKMSAQELETQLRGFYSSWGLRPVALREGVMRSMAWSCRDRDYVPRADLRKAGGNTNVVSSTPFCLCLIASVPPSFECSWLSCIGQSQGGCVSTWYPYLFQKSSRTVWDRDPDSCNKSYIVDCIQYNRRRCAMCSHIVHKPLTIKMYKLAPSMCYYPMVRRMIHEVTSKADSTASPYAQEMSTS